MKSKVTSPPCSPHESRPAPGDGGVDIGGWVVDQGGNHLGVAFAGCHHQGGRGGHQAGPFLNRVQRFKDNIGTSLFGSAPEARSSLVVSALPQFAASQRSQLSWDESKVELMLYLMSGLLLENSWGRGGKSRQVVGEPDSCVVDQRDGERSPCSQHQQTLR